MEAQLKEVMTLEDIQAYIFEQLPRVLEQNPSFVTWIEGIVAEKFPRRDEFARLLDEVRDLRGDMQQRFGQVDQRFEKIDQRFEQVDQRFAQVDQRFDRLETEMRQGFHDLHVTIDRLGARWGIRNESIFRQTMQAILERSFGVAVERRLLGGEEFDCVISNGDHILVEIAASVRQNIVERLERKRQLYIQETGITPTRFILVVGSIHSRRAEELRAAGFEVIEPED